MLALTLVSTAPAVAGTLAGVSMSKTAKAGDETLILNGMALRKKAIFKVYVGGLYLPEKQADPGAVLEADTARQFVMHWVRSVGKESICQGWQEGLEANTPNASAELEGDFEELCSLMEDAKTADRFVFSYVPGTGTSVEVKKKQKGVIDGKAFADALFACWIGPEPGPGESFREALMGG
jgi:hypothetical protein